MTQHDGVIILTWVHNIFVRLPHDGAPLPPHGYEALVSDMPHRLVADSDVLRRYREKQGPALARGSEASQLAQEPVLSIVASNNPKIFQDYGSFEEWPHAEGHLELNPLYSVRKSRKPSGEVELDRVLPSELYAKDHAECQQYLPETITVPSGIMADMEHGRRTPEVLKLIDRFVVVDVPERYR